MVAFTNTLYKYLSNPAILRTHQETSPRIIQDWQLHGPPSEQLRKYWNFRVITHNLSLIFSRLVSGVKRHRSRQDLSTMSLCNRVEVHELSFSSKNVDDKHIRPDVFSSCLRLLVLRMFSMRFVNHWQNTIQLFEINARLKRSARRYILPNYYQYVTLIKSPRALANPTPNRTTKPGMDSRRPSAPFALPLLELPIG